MLFFHSDLNPKNPQKILTSSPFFPSVHFSLETHRVESYKRGPMKLSLLFAVAALVLSATFVVADENHEILEKVMKEGMKGDESPLAKVLDAKASAEETAALATLIQTMKGTKAPLGEQSDFDKKVEELITAMDAVANGDKTEKAITRLDDASNCKACHSKHKPKD